MYFFFQVEDMAEDVFLLEAQNQLFNKMQNPKGLKATVNVHKNVIFLKCCVSLTICENS